MAQHTPVIIKKVRKKSHGGHHGGAWKVAYADFVTAMMAFFLLLWLLNVVTDEQLKGIADYFSPVTVKVSTGTSGGSGIMTGKTVGAVEDFPDPFGTPRTTFQERLARIGVVDVDPDPDADDPDAEAEGLPRHRTPEAREVDADDLDAMLRQREEQQFREAEAVLREALEGTPQFKVLANSLLIDQTQEGLRIQILDQDGLAMFPLGSADMYLHTRRLLELVARVIEHMPQQVAITGHTDATPFAQDRGYGNWELSADRANAARRALLGFGVPEARFSRVVGKAATDPLIAGDPHAPANRRLSVVLIRGTQWQDRASIDATDGAFQPQRRDVTLQIDR
ncbi:MAG: hypothetical protein EA406_04755 [Rhodospirillales bacterium]|nr:MAG: hypothetical protein EA406_04755 [Rhodospirillales bacterium]